MKLSLITLSLSAAAATSLPSTKPALSASASSRVSPGSPTMKMLGADQVTPDNNAWKGGSEQKITWKFEGAVPEVDIWLQRPYFGLPDGMHVKGLAYKVKNTGSHVVTAPTGLVPGKFPQGQIRERRPRLGAQSDFHHRQVGDASQDHRRSSRPPAPLPLIHRAAVASPPRRPSLIGVSTGAGETVGGDARRD